ncbi:MAG: SDR family NAD(P)-dependent oxidoreductase [Rhodospirillales bacterium]|jgi:nucleoside-diphosphate-sugar epimerase|nr:SDR family NAD(P)-dependent oxidoreductase [Rhodospirillales bacterium]MDP6883782.1 SDR family NAD(P)-dependent oxidoreductase [Rhodospirillales bacterium]
MTPRHVLVTGGTGFIGAALVRRLLGDGHRVRVLDNDSRGSATRLDDIADDFERISGDVRDADAVEKAARGVEAVHHLAFVNGTEFFYEKPELVLDVGVKGMVNVLDACIKAEVGELVLASSSEVYQHAPRVPTDEAVPLSIPDPTNPRYSYAGGKIISEIMALNYGRKHFERVLIFRPHNVYGPDMGWEHVLPQFVLRMKKLSQKTDSTVKFPIQGTGKETRAFVFIDDFVDGLAIMFEHGEHLGIYNIGSTEEVAIADVARMVGEIYGRGVNVVAGPPAEGGTPRRCPDIGKLAALGYRPQVTLSQGLPVLARWYDANADKAPADAS